jgi:uracil-DNA glycosylase
MSKLLEQIGDWGPIHTKLVEDHPGLYGQLKDFIKFHRTNYTVYPASPEVYKAFELCQMKDLRVVIIGQDPYHNGAATGLAFGVKEGMKINPSLRVIQREICRSHGIDESDAKTTEFDYSLSHLAKQGVLLLNTTLTVTKGKPNSHEQIWGWYTKGIVREICNELDGVIFLLWGKFAQHAFGGIIKEVNSFHDKSHIIFAASHPAAEVYGGNARFIGCNHFIKVNEIIAEPIDWFKLPEKKEDELESQFNLL